MQDGVVVWDVDHSYRYLGSAAASTSGAVLDTASNRLLWNQYNRVPRSILLTASGGWYLSGNNNWRPVNNSASSSASVLVGGLYGFTSPAAASFQADNTCVVTAPAGGTGLFATSVRVDGVVSPLSVSGNAGTSLYSASYSFYNDSLVPGLHTVTWVEIGYTGTTYYCYGAATTPPFGKSALTGFVTM